MAHDNPFYDNSLQANQTLSRVQPYVVPNYHRPLQVGARNVLQKDDLRSVAQELSQQIQDKERQKKAERMAQWEYERKIQQQSVVYLSNYAKQQKQLPYDVMDNQNQQQPINQPQQQQPAQQQQQPQQQPQIQIQQQQYQQNRVPPVTVYKPYNQQIINQDKNSSGGFFANVFDQKEVKLTQQQIQRQQYAEEIQRQIMEKKQKKDEEARRKYEEDMKYEEQVKKELEEMKLRFQKEEEQRLQAEKQKQEQQRQEIEKREQAKAKKTTIMDHPQVQPQQESVSPQDQTIHLDNTIQQNIIPQFLEESHDQGQWREQTSRKSTNRQYQDYQQQQQYQDYQQQQQYQQYQQQPPQQPPFDPYPPQNYQLPPNRETMALQKYLQDYEQVLAMNRQKQIEQEQEMKAIRHEFDQQVSVLDLELRRLRAEEQLSHEQKRNAFVSLEHLRDELKRQEMKEQQKLQSFKQQIMQPQPQYQRPQLRSRNHDLSQELHESEERRFIPLDTYL